MGLFIKGGISEKKIKEDESEPECIQWLSELSSKDVSIAGGKGASLADMYTKKFPIPPAFVITTHAFNRFIEDVSPQIKKIIEETDVENTGQLNESSKKIRSLIEVLEFLEETEKEILEAYEFLGTDKRDPHISKDALGILKVAKEPAFVAVRSSATTEDLAEASFAGQQETYLNIKGNSKLLSAVKKCFSSLYTSRAIYYRNKQGIKYSSASLAVIVQKMINSDKSGVMFTKNPVKEDGNALIEAVFGLGQGIVSGQIQPDSYWINPDLDILEKRIGDKKKAIVRSGAGETEEVKLTENRSLQQVLTDGQIKEIADLGLKIEKNCGKPQDIEFAVEDGTVYIVQSRPITTFGKNKKAIELTGKVLLSGLAASSGVASGKVKIVAGLDDLLKVKKGDVLVTEMTNPDIVVAMHLADAIVTNKGGITSHAAILSREMGIPCVVGTKKATVSLKEGQVVTVDGTEGKIYEGEVLEEKKKEIPAVNNTNTKTKIKVAVDLPELAEKAAESKCEAVGLLRLEGIIAASGKHPLKFLEEGELEEYSEIIRKGVEAIAEHFDSVWVRASDIRTDELRQLEGSPEEVEVNPMLGLHGARFSLKNRPILMAELNAIRKIAEKYPIKKLGIMFPKIISVQEAVEARKEFSKIRTDNMEFGLMVDTPAAVQIIDELCDVGLDFVMLYADSLTQYTLAVDRSNPAVQELYNEQHPAVLREIGKVIEECKKNGVKTSIYGQASSDPEMVKFLVSKGIYSITVNADAAKELSELIQGLEENIEEENIKSHVQQVTREIIAGEKTEPVATKEIEEAQGTPLPLVENGYQEGIENIDNLGQEDKKLEEEKKTEEEKEEKRQEDKIELDNEEVDIFEGIKPEKSVEEAETMIITKSPKIEKNSLLDLISTDFLYTTEFSSIQKAIESKVEQIKRGKLEAAMEEKEEKEISKIEANIEMVQKELVYLATLEPLMANSGSLEPKMPENEALAANTPEKEQLQESKQEHEVLDIF